MSLLEKIASMVELRCTMERMMMTPLSQIMFCSIAIADEGVLNRWYRDADNDGFGTSTNDTYACSKPSGYVSNSTDCDDTNASINPDANEIFFNGVDEDCSPAGSD